MVRGPHTYVRRDCSKFDRYLIIPIVDTFNNRNTHVIEKDRDRTVTVHDSSERGWEPSELIVFLFNSGRLKMKLLILHIVDVVDDVEDQGTNAIRHRIGREVFGPG